MLSAQMYTLRGHCETPADIDATCARVAALGYRGIQASAAGFNTIDADALRSILDKHRLACVATHRSLDQLRNIDATAAFHETIDCPLVALGWHKPDGPDRRAVWDAFADEFTTLAERYAAHGLRLGYHHHAHELAPFALDHDPANTALDDCPLVMLMDRLPASGFLLLDTYWLAAAGASPAAWLARYAGRVPAIHLKDMTVNADGQPKFCEVGAGHLDWPAILAAADAAQVEHLIVERDDGPLDPFDSLAASRQFLLDHHRASVD